MFFIVFYRVLNDNYILFQPFFLKPSDELILKSLPEGLLRTEILKENNKINKIKCLTDVKDKIFSYQYKSLAAFEHDIKIALDHIYLCLGSSCIQIKEAIKTFYVKLGQKTAAQKKKIAVRKLEYLMETNASRINKAAPLFHLYPSHNQLQLTKEPKLNKTDPLTWVQLLGREIIERNTAKPIVIEQVKRVDSLLKASAILIKQKKQESLTNLPLEKTTSHALLMKQLDEQEYSTRKVLEGFRDLKHKIETNSTLIDGIKYNGKPVSLGDLSLVGEFRLANRNLTAQIDNLTLMLSIERKKRVEAEKQLSRLKDILRD